ncbi:insulinase family protein [Candidatus Wolfebacteria bacterium]|nr:insulinase family protein [Candidatus Wolfebacteria bacterium]
MTFKKLTLKNGLRIILAPKEDSLASTILILVEAGSKYEAREVNGLSHFLEHMCFKGTERRPRAIDIASELDSIGSLYNAFTGLEYTGYFAKAEPRHFDTILDVVSDIYLNQIFDQKEINKERGVIIEEINMYEDLPMRRVHELFTELLYGDQPAGWSIAGRKEIIQKLNREDFIKYKGEHYLGQSTIVVLAGKFDEGAAAEKIENAFSQIKITPKVGKIKTEEKQEKPGVCLKSKKTDQTHLILGVRAFDVFDERKYALDLLVDILGGSMSSRLFQKIREEMGAAYYVRAGADLFSDHGYLAAQAGIDYNRIEAVLEAILEEFKKIKEKPVSDAELEKAKEHSVGTLMLGLETSDALAGFYGDQEVVTRRLVSPQELASKIRKVKAEEIQAVASEIFKDERLNLAVIGPLTNQEKFEKILTLR